MYYGDLNCVVRGKGRGLSTSPFAFAAKGGQRARPAGRDVDIQRDRPHRSARRMGNARIRSGFRCLCRLSDSVYFAQGLGWTID